MSHFVVAGCGRSGTMFTWQLLNWLDVRTSFEEFFGSQARCVTADDYKTWLQSTSTAGEVSGLSPPYSSIMAEAGVTVVHLVRNPVAVIASLLGLNTFTKPMVWSRNVKFNFRHVPEMNLTDDPLDLALKYWLHWNAMVEPHAAAWFRAEDLTTVGAVSRLVCACTGSSAVDTAQAKTALGHFGKTWNAKDRKGIRWASIPDSQLKTQVAMAAERYGYGMDELREHCPHCGVL